MSKQHHDIGSRKRRHRQHHDTDEQPSTERLAQLLVERGLATRRILTTYRPRNAR